MLLMLMQRNSSIFVRLSIVVSKTVSAVIVLGFQTSSGDRVTIVPVSATQDPSSGFSKIVDAAVNPVEDVSGDIYVFIVLLQFRIAVPRPVAHKDSASSVACTQPPSVRYSTNIFQIPVAFQSVVVTESVSADALPVAGHRGKSGRISGEPGCSRRPEVFATAPDFSELSTEPVQPSGNDWQPIKSCRCLGNGTATASPATWQSGGTIKQGEAVGHYRNCQQNCSK